MKTFDEVGRATGLDGITLKRYVTYMERRWKAQEQLQCQTGYAQEWAERFKGGDEYACSDVDGQSILEEILRGRIT